MFEEKCIRHNILVFIYESASKKEEYQIGNKLNTRTKTSKEIDFQVQMIIMLS
jgi:hypothetical protein